LIHNLREVTALLGQRWHGIGWGGYSLDLAIALVVGEEEDLVTPDGPTERAAELVLVVGSAQRIEESASIEISVAEKLENVTVEMVCSRLSDDVDLPAAVVAVLRIIVVGQNSEFRDRIQVGNRRRPTETGLLHGGPVKQEAIARLALSVDRKRPRPEVT